MANTKMLPDAIKAWANEAIDEDERGRALLDKVISLGHKGDNLELIHIPAAKDINGVTSTEKFNTLLTKLHTTRQEHGYEGGEHWRWSPLWDDKAEIFGDYGIKNEPQWLVLVHSDEVEGLWFTDKAIEEQIVESKQLMADKPRLNYLTPAAYVCAQIQRASNARAKSEDEYDSTELLDFNKGDFTFTRFPQYSEDGFIQTADGRHVPRVCVYDDGRLEFVGSNGLACWRGGVRFAVVE
ncbi:hypothetical protein AGMMS49975_15860 [Clostridia bacterium]|nr:hypothetical protein AGMMS49975_15860 [Clostridia bacterium]